MSEKSFNPSANPSLYLILGAKVAEGFGLQTLQEGSVAGVVFSVSPSSDSSCIMPTSPDLGLTSRRVVLSSPGLVF